MKSFKEKVISVVSEIPQGKTLSYREVAKKAGNEKGARAVGAILKTNFDTQVPCHRVIKKNGQIGGYNRGEAQKRILLNDENAL